MEVRSVQIDGRRASYREWGTGEPVLYLHGFPTSGYLWRKVGQEVGKSFRAIAPDLPGFGDSDLREGEHSWESLSAWIESLTEALELNELHLGVHDWGGLIGLRWACDHPQKVKSLLITDTSFSSEDRWHALATQWRTPGVGEEMMGQWTSEALASMLASIGKVPADAATEYWKCMATPQHRAAKLEMYRSLDFEMLAPYEPILPSVAPGRVRVVWGENDPFVPRKMAYRFGERLSATVTVLEGAGHFLQEDQGEELGRLHLEFLETQQA